MLYAYVHHRSRHDGLPTASAGPAGGSGGMIDFNVRAERMGWLPSSPQLETNPLEVCKAAEAAGKEVADFALEQLKSGDLRLSCEDPDNPKNFPRNLFVWRSNLLGASGKGHEYFLRSEEHTSELQSLM